MLGQNITGESVAGQPPVFKEAIIQWTIVCPTESVWDRIQPNSVATVKCNTSQQGDT